MFIPHEERQKLMVMVIFLEKLRKKEAKIQIGPGVRIIN